MLKTCMMAAIMILLFVCAIRAQGEFLAKGQNGFGFSATVFGLGLSLVFKTNERNKVVVSSGVRATDDNTTFSLGAGFIFSTP